MARWLRLRRHGRWPLIAVLVVGVWIGLPYAAEPMQDAGFYAFDAAIASFAGAVALVGAVFVARRLHCRRTLREDFLNDAGTEAKWLVPALLVLVLFGFCIWVGNKDRSSGLIHDYCAYGAASSAQLESCMDDTAKDEIRQLDTDAGRFARRESDLCAARNSGPFCEDVVLGRLIEIELQMR